MLQSDFVVALRGLALRGTTRGARCQERSSSRKSIINDFGSCKVDALSSGRSLADMGASLAELGREEVDFGAWRTANLAECGRD